MIRLCDYTSVKEKCAGESVPPGYWEYFADVAKVLLEWRQIVRPKRTEELEDMVRSRQLCGPYLCGPAATRYLSTTTFTSLRSLNGAQTGRRKQPLLFFLGMR